MEKIKKLKKPNLFPIKKQYLLEDDFIIEQDNKLKSQNKMFSIYDYRFFENNIQKIPILVLISSGIINKKMINLFGDMQAFIISTSQAVIF